MYLVFRDFNRDKPLETRYFASLLSECQLLSHCSFITCIQKAGAIMKRAQGSKKDLEFYSIYLALLGT